MKFFLPYWEDKLDPGFDFETDQYSRTHIENGTRFDKYVHELTHEPPYDGLLFSLGVFLEKMTLDQSDGNRVSIKGYQNLRDYLRLDYPHKLQLMGDCGAFNYVNEPEPPEQFNPARVASLYDTLGMDLGVSVDHLVVKTIKVKDRHGKLINKELSLYERRKRISVSLTYAEEFLKICQANGYGFVPVGSAQGYSPRTYRNSVAQLIEMGYDYIALGGMVRLTTKEILETLRTIHPVLKGRSLHLLGILRPRNLSVFQQYGVSSFDSASFLRKAWLRSGQNYLAHDLSKWYTAIRVPQVHNPRMVRSVEEAGWRFNDAVALESECLFLLRQYARGAASMDAVLKKVIQYDSLYLRNGDDGRDLEDRYRQTLRERPWEKCSCDFCSALGIDIMIFRGTNRNKRRGFHNNIVFYKYLKDLRWNTSHVDSVVAD